MFVVVVEVRGHALLKAPYIVGPLALLLHPPHHHPHYPLPPLFTFITLMWYCHLSHYHS